MNDKVFYGILAVVVVAGIVSVVALVGYTYELYENVSIISYIANGR